MNYKIRRVRKQISVYTMAKELGISKKKYKEVESGLRNLENNLLDKFCETLENATQINVNRKIKLLTINEWIKSNQIIKDMTQMGYNEKTLANVLEVTKQSIHKVVINKKTSDDLKEEVYDFLKNPMNKIIKKEKIQNKSKYNLGGINLNNNLNKLNDMLFEELNKLNSANVDEINTELDRANSMSKLASQIISNANLGLRAVELANSMNLDKKQMPQALVYSKENE